MDNSALNQGENTNEVKVETKSKDTKVEANDKLKLPKIEDDNKVAKTKKTFKFGPVKESRLGGGLGDADDDGEDKKAKTQKKSKKKLIEEIQAHLMEKKVQKQKQTDESGKKNENNNKKITLEENDFEGIDINEMDRIQMQVTHNFLMIFWLFSWNKTFILFKFKIYFNFINYNIIKSIILFFKNPKKTKLKTKFQLKPLLF